MSKRRSQEQFFQELTQLLITEGISRLTIAEMAARLKCSRRRLYEIAPSKEEIFTKVCEQVFNGNLQRSLLAASKQDRPDAAISVYLRSALNSSGMSKAALIDLDNLVEGRAIFDAYQKARMHALQDLMRKGMEEGVLMPHHPRAISEALLGAAFRLRDQKFLEEEGLSIGDAFNEFYNVILHGLLKRP
ncbi:TetR/AcrR family transcriptional regulator [Achromobacter sp. F4_2707]|uniref:TetR/AcrR family transcriptional regulator n=1 Tax=Achromobacter sp. F4_2707 TaxID=3114286 RepID=UPI0039C64432